MYSIQLLNRSKDWADLRVDVEVRELISGSEEFGCEIVPAIQAILRPYLLVILLHKCD